MGDKNVDMYKDSERGELWVIASSDNHILPKGTCLGGLGGGRLNMDSTAGGTQVLFRIPNDKALV